MGDTLSQLQGGAAKTTPVLEQGADKKDPHAGLRGLDLASQEAALSPDKQAGPSTKSFGHWTQSGLNQVDQGTPFLARKLAIDGVTGPATKAGIRAFQAAADRVMPGVGALPRTGAMDATTTWVLEQATSSKNPAGRATKAPPALAPAPGAPELTGAADKKAAGPGPEATDQIDGAAADKADGDDGAVAAAMKTKIAALPQPGGPSPVKVTEAYAELVAWTLEQAKDTGNKDTARAKKTIATKLARAAKAAAKKGAAPPDPAKFEQANFFREYWMLHCDQFAHALMQRINGPGYPSLEALRARTNAAVTKGEAEGKAGPAVVGGRDVSHRGMTMHELGKALAESKAEAGIGVHVKLRPEVDRPYEKAVKDEMHHWYVHVGNGLFSDSFGSGKTGQQNDEFLRGWIDQKFHQRGRKGETFDYSLFHTPAYAEPATLDELERLDKDGKGHEAASQKLPKAKPGVQSKVTAIYRPFQVKTAAKKKGTP